MSRITHHAITTNGRDLNKTRCGLNNINLWASTKRKLVTCLDCKGS